MGLFGKKKKLNPEAATGPSIPAGPPPAPSGFPMGQPPPPGLPMGPPPAPGGPVVRNVDDWRALCQQQHEQLIADVRAFLDTCGSDIAATQMDTSWIDRRFLPIDRKLEAAKRLVRSTWNRSGDFSGEHMALELDMGELELELVREHGYRTVRALAARAMMNFALHQDARTRACGGCGQFMPTLLVGQAQHTQCRHCGFAQVVEPGQAFRIFASVAARWVGESDGFPQFATVKRFEAQLDSHRDKHQVPLELLRSYYHASEQYWSTVLVIEGQLVPERQPHLQMHLQAMMTDANRRLSSYWQWREHMA